MSLTSLNLKNHYNLFNTAASICLTPARLLFNGRTFTVVYSNDGKVTSATVNPNDKQLTTLRKVAALIVILAPSLLWGAAGVALPAAFVVVTLTGAVARYISLFDSKIKAGFEATQKPAPKDRPEDVTITNDRRQDVEGTKAKLQAIVKAPNNEVAGLVKQLTDGDKRVLTTLPNELSALFKSAREKLRGLKIVSPLFETDRFVKLFEQKEAVLKQLSDFNEETFSDRDEAVRWLKSNCPSGNFFPLIGLLTNDEEHDLRDLIDVKIGDNIGKAHQKILAFSGCQEFYTPGDLTKERCDEVLEFLQEFKESYPITVILESIPKEQPYHPYHIIYELDRYKGQILALEDGEDEWSALVEAKEAARATTLRDGNYIDEFQPQILIKIILSKGDFRFLLEDFLKKFSGNDVTPEAVTAWYHSTVTHDDSNKGAFYLYSQDASQNLDAKYFMSCLGRRFNYSENYQKALTIIQSVGLEELFGVPKKENPAESQPAMSEAQPVAQGVISDKQRKEFKQFFAHVKGHTNLNAEWLRNQIQKLGENPFVTLAKNSETLAQMAAEDTKFTGIYQGATANVQKSKDLAREFLPQNA